MSKREKKLSEVNDREYLSIPEAAKEMGLTLQALRNYMSQGKFTTYSFKSLRLLKREDVEAWKARKR